MMILVSMSYTEAQILLDRRRNGEHFSQAEIATALVLTGDIDIQSAQRPNIEWRDAQPQERQQWQAY